MCYIDLNYKKKKSNFGKYKFMEEFRLIYKENFMEEFRLVYVL